MTGTIASVAGPIRVDEVVAGSTGLASLLPRFAERDHLYVLDGDGIQGVVTRADLQLPPVSMAVLGLVVSLEMALTELIATYSHGSWLEQMQDGRRKKLLERFDRARRANAEITELECLDLTDRFDLVGRISPLGEALGIASPNRADKVRKRNREATQPARSWRHRHRCPRRLRRDAANDRRRSGPCSACLGARRQQSVRLGRIREHQDHPVDPERGLAPRQRGRRLARARDHRPQPRRSPALPARQRSRQLTAPTPPRRSR